MSQSSNPLSHSGTSVPSHTWSQLTQSHMTALMTKKVEIRPLELFLPLQMNPLPSNPVLHVQMKLPSVSLHSALESHGGCSSHSLMSVSCMNRDRTNHNVTFALRQHVMSYRISGNFRVVNFSCFIISCHNIFVDWVTHEKIFTATSLTRGEKKYEGLAARLPRLSGTLGSSCWPRTRE